MSLPTLASNPIQAQMFNASNPSQPHDYNAPYLNQQEHCPYRIMKSALAHKSLCCFGYEPDETPLYLEEDNHLLCGNCPHLLGKSDKVNYVSDYHDYSYAEMFAVLGYDNV